LEFLNDRRIWKKCDQEYLTNMQSKSFNKYFDILTQKPNVKEMKTAFFVKGVKTRY